MTLTQALILALYPDKTTLTETEEQQVIVLLSTAIRFCNNAGLIANPGAITAETEVVGSLLEDIMMPYIEDEVEDEPPLTDNPQLEAMHELIRSNCSGQVKLATVLEVSQ